MIVVDASVAAKLVIREPDSHLAERWYAEVKGEIVAPELIVVEVAQAVVRRVNARETAAVQGQTALAAWRTILDREGIILIGMPPGKIYGAANLAIEVGHPVKDCVYLALAIELNATLVTADAKFRDRSARLYPAIELLETVQ